jgi:hypothetical protein
MNNDHGGGDDHHHGDAGLEAPGGRLSLDQDILL